MGSFATGLMSGAGSALKNAQDDNGKKKFKGLLKNDRKRPASQKKASSSDDNDPPPDSYKKGGTVRGFRNRRFRKAKLHGGEKIAAGRGGRQKRGSSKSR